MKGAGAGKTILKKTTSANGVMFLIYTPPLGTFLMSDLTIDGGGLYVSPSGTIRVLGTSNNLNAFRFHHFELLNSAGRGFEIALKGFEIGGLIDHGTITQTGSGTKWFSLEGTGPEQHQPFARPLSLGSNKAVFVEDNVIENTDVRENIDGWNDAYAGARYVWRYNTHLGCPAEIGHHGADSGNARGVISAEIYSNRFTQTRKCNYKTRGLFFRSGTGVVFDNTWTGEGYYPGMELTNYRSDGITNYPPWGTCNGSSPWDGNVPGEYGWPCLDQIGHVFGPKAGGLSTSEPLYGWNNTWNGQISRFYAETINHKSNRHIKEGRDFFNETRRPGYAPYTYPHPLQGVRTPAAP